MTEPVWFPSDPASTNVGRFMAAHGIATFEELSRRSVDEPEWFWAAVVDFLGLPFTRRWDRVLDVSKGIPWATWFTGGRLNFAQACLRHPASRRAVVWEGEDGDVRDWTYGELGAQVDALCALLEERGIGVGDRVGVFMPMLPETVAAVLAVAKMGAVFLPLFSGYGVEAVASRLNDGSARALITADGSYRRGKATDMLAIAEQAVAQSPTVETLVVVPRLGRGVGSGLPWPTPVEGVEPRVFEDVDSEHPLFIAYTSGTTGRPKGSVHVHGGWLVKVAEEAAFQTDCTADDVLFWFTDIGWIMGPWEITGALSNGATLALYEGAPDWPEADRLWAFIERHRVTILGISPTLVRSLMPHGDGPVKARDVSSLRILGSTGEPWNEGPWRWFFSVVGGERCPVVNFSGGTEVGACFLSVHPVTPLKPMSLGSPSLGMAVDVFDDDGKPVREAVGELVCTAPWPGMTRGLYQDPERYIETYWSRWPDVWVHGDWASVDDDGYWFLHGRSDDTIKLAGKRLGPAEVESALVSHPAVLEAAAIGVPDELKGEALWAYVVLAPGTEETEALRAELVAVVTDNLGKSFKPSAVKFCASLPKTRSAKVLRRAVRAVAIGKDPGDLSSLDDPATIEAVRAAR
ncbi:MAG: AMP-binding protein [Actinobacteria bacterium]|nr:AMP-binding protein [Actinomycetota bacterium]